MNSESDLLVPLLKRSVMRAMNERDWDDVTAALHDAQDVDRAVAAAEKLNRAATMEDIPRLRNLLKDPSFFVREAAAWPLSDLGAIEALPDMLEALHQGAQEGHDNDGLCAALADLAEANPKEASAMLRSILASGRPHLRERAIWLLDFCDGKRDA